MALRNFAIGREVLLVNWLDRLERRFGRVAIKGLMTYIVALNGIVFLLMLLDPTGIFVHKLTLIPAFVLRGEIWRLVTYIFIPPDTSLLWIIFALYFYYMVGNSLEHEWGTFKFNIYYFIGMVGTTVAAFITSGETTAVYLNLSLFLAFARLFPDYQLLIFFILPVRVKYLAWLQWAFLGATVFIFNSPLSYKIAAVVSVVNYFIFFGKDIFIQLRTGRRSYYNRKRFHAEIPRDFTIHRCTVCGLTEKTDPNMDFRYCMQCEGDYEYCMEHLNSHEHIKRSSDK